MAAQSPAGARTAGGRILLAERLLRGLLRPARGLDSRAHICPSGKDFRRVRAARVLCDERGKISSDGFRDLPREAIYFFGIIFLLFISALLSPVWKGGAFFRHAGFRQGFGRVGADLLGDHQFSRDCGESFSSSRHRWR